MIVMKAESSDVQDILSEAEGSLQDRLRIAINIFTTDGSSIIKNKKHVLTWFRNVTKSDLSSDERKSIFDALKCCILHLKSEPLYRPQLVEPILSILLSTESMSDEVAECFAQVLSSECFFKYFSFHIQSYVDLVDTFVKNIQSWGDRSWETKVLKMIQNITLPAKFNILTDSIFRVCFVERFIGILVSLVKSLNVETSSTNLSVIVWKVLFNDEKFRNYFSQNIFAESLHPNTPESEVITKIREYPRVYANDPDSLSLCYSILYAGFIRSNATERDKFKILVIFCNFIGVRPVDLDETHGKCLQLKNIQTVNSLIQSLYSCDVSLDLEMNGFTLSDWLSGLIADVLESNRMDHILLELLTKCFEFSPTLIENCLRTFAKNVMLKRKVEEDIIQGYSDLCLYVLNVFVKLNRMQKLIAAWLMIMKEHLPAISTDILPSKSDILPPIIFDRIQTTITNLPSTVQSVALLNTLLFHFETDCICILEQDQCIKADEKHLIMCDIVTHLISCFIYGTRIADHSVPEVVKEKFTKLMDDLAALLGRFGEAILTKEYADKLVDSFLRLSFVWGEMQLVFFTYDTCRKRVPKQLHDTKPTNLVYLHPYLADTHWQAIAQRVLNFGDQNCVSLLNNLILQKIHALRYLEDEVQGSYVEDAYGETPAVLGAYFLSRHANATWLLDNISQIIHLLNSDDVLNISKRLVEHILGCLKLNRDTEVVLAKTQNLCTMSQEIRPVVAAMAFRVFNLMRKSLALPDLHVSKELLREIVSIEMNEEESNTSETIRTKLDDVGSLISKNSGPYDDDLRRKTASSEIRLLVNLPVDSLRQESKSMLSALTLLLVKNMTQVEPESRAILIEWCKFLSEVMPGSTLPKTLDGGKVMAFLYRRIGDVPCWSTIAKNLIELSPDRDSIVDSVLKVVKKGDNLKMNERTDVFVSFSLCCRQTRKRRPQTNNDYGEPEKKLQKFSYDNFDEIFQTAVEGENGKSSKLALFTLLLRDALESEDKLRMDKLSVKITHFLSLVQEHPDFSPETNSEFISVLLRYNAALRDVLRRDFIVETWFACCYYLNDETIVNFLKVFNEEEYLCVIEILFADTEGMINLCDDSREVESFLIRLWRIIFETPVKEAKTKHKTKIVAALCKLALKMCSRSQGSNKLCSVFAGIFKTVIRTKVPLQYQCIDTFFELVSILIANDHDHQYLDVCAELLFVFCVVRAPLLADRVPTFYLCYKSLYAKIAQTCWTDEDRKENIVSISAADKLEKLTDSLLKNKRDFAKTAISAVGDFITVLIGSKIEEAVKTHLKRIIFLWIGACDSHGLQYLSSTLPPVPQNLFKQMCSDYDKYFKFSGKV